MMKNNITTKTSICKGNLILINSIYSLNTDEDAELILVDENSNILLQRQAAIFLKELMDSINGWNYIVPVSGWRSFEEQTKIWNDTIKKSGPEFTKKFVAAPGHSEHQSGLAIDLGLKQKNIDFICPEFPYTGICQKFRSLAADYGFIQRYPADKENITGISHEPWHFRYVGVPHAKIMKEHDFTLEEYIAFLKQYCKSKTPYTLLSSDRQIQIYYIPSEKETDIQSLINGNFPCVISGNNADGYIITEWRSLYVN